MRFFIDEGTYQQLKDNQNQCDDCFAHEGEYLHHLYVDGTKYVVARALVESIALAEQNENFEALEHLSLHKNQLDKLIAEAQQKGGLRGVRVLGDSPPEETENQPPPKNSYVPALPKNITSTGLSRTMIEELILRTIHAHGQPTGGEIARELKISYQIIGPLLQQMRTTQLIDVMGQRGVGEAAYQFVTKPPRGPQAIRDALDKSSYSGPAPVPFEDYLKAIKAQTIKNMIVTRRNIRHAFSDLIVSEQVLNEIGPAVNSTDSIFLFGYPGNGKTSIAERITNLMGDDVYIPYTIEAEGQFIKLFDPIIHTRVETSRDSSFLEQASLDQNSGPGHDPRYVKIKRPVVVTGGELILEMLDLAYSEHGKFYEAPLQMKANLGIFMIDDFGRQQVRPMDLLNRWIVPLEKRYDFLTTATGQKLQIPFDLLLIFSTNLDPHQVADEAFLRRIKYKIEIRDPDESQWRHIWELVCKSKGVELDQQGLDYMLAKWIRPFGHPLRMVQPRDILNLMINFAKYNLESLTFSPDLIDAACDSYFISQEAQDFGAKVRLE